MAVVMQRKKDLIETLIERARTRPWQVGTCSACLREDQPIWWWTWDDGDAICFECGNRWHEEVLAPSIREDRAKEPRPIQLARRVDVVASKVARLYRPGDVEGTMRSVRAKLVRDGTVDVERLTYWERRLGIA